VSDDFYTLWLDPRRVYSCAYYRECGMNLAQAQEAVLDHICRKLVLQPCERFLDIGAGWGALLLWAAEHYGVDATGITLSKNQHAHVQSLIADKGLQDRVRIELRDYRQLDEALPFKPGPRNRLCRAAGWRLWLPRGHPSGGLGQSDEEMNDHGAHISPLGGVQHGVPSVVRAPRGCRSWW
jgi:hypothetical protein